MPVIDFKEIASPASGPLRDQFELFAREFLESLGLRIVIGPDRGPDAGRDLVVEEIRAGVAGTTPVKWLVSCKHKAFSGDAVSPADEPDIHDRVKTHGCQGFLAVYSTIPSSGLAAKINAPGLPFELQVFDPERIEKHLLANPESLKLAQRFFPKSIARWKDEHPTPAMIFEGEPLLTCANCGNNLLTPKPHGIVVVWKTFRSDNSPLTSRTEHVYWCCKGICDKTLANKYRRIDIFDTWEDISDLILPIIYIRWIMGMLNHLQLSGAYSKEAFDNSKTLLLNLFPLVSRHMSDGDKKRVDELTMIPNYLGGLGYED